MKLPDKFYQNLTLLLLAILAAGLLSAFVLPPEAATKAGLADVLVKGPSINEDTNYSPLLINSHTKIPTPASQAAGFFGVGIKWLLALLAGLATVKGYEYFCDYRPGKNPKDLSPDIKTIKATLDNILSLEEKTAPPRFIKRKATYKARLKSARFSSEQTCLSGRQARKIIDSSRSLSKFKVKQ